MDGSFGIIIYKELLLVGPVSAEHTHSCSAIEALSTRKKRRAQDISSNGRRITPYPNWLTTYGDMSDNAT